MFCLVCFDIVEDPARAKVVKILKEYGVRVQKSVFECADLNERRFLKMKTQIEDHIDAGEDSVRYYVICRQCLDKVEFTGTGKSPEKKDFRVV
ncbi:MAG: CRISPR-associated endonuclease Cas2 [Desulfobacterales bacterium]|nr:CRISPR-associated endonuclease Cas2 [Desulfobacterales bacterium]